MADSSIDDARGQNVIQDDDIGPSSRMTSREMEVKAADVDETDTAPPPPSSPISNNGDGNPYSRSDHDHDDNPNNISPIITSMPKNKKQKQRDKMQRRVPGSLDLDYITPRIIGMAPPRVKFGNAAGVGGDDNNSNDATAAAAIKQQSNRQRRQKGNDPGELSTFLEKRHARRYLLFNVSDEDADDRSLLLLGKQVVHLPWGSPKIPHPNDEINNDGTTPKGQIMSNNSPMGGDSPYSFFRRDTTESSATGGGKSPSSGTPAIARVMDICYALHAYLSIPPQDLPMELQQQEEQSSLQLLAQQQQHQQQFPKLKKKKGKHNHHSQKSSTVACIYCGNGKTRTGVIVACYLRFCNEVPDALSGFDIFCHRRGIKSSSSNSADDISSHIPPSLRQFFSNFDELVAKNHYPYSKPLMLKSIHLQGVPVDDMPCVDIFEYGDVIKEQIYSSHDDTSLNQWDDEEGTYKIGQLLSQDFTLVCRFGGEFAGDDQDPSKVLFRYVNSPNFMNEGNFELGMVNVDMMRRYADSFDEEDFLLTLVFESDGDEDKHAYSHSRKKKLMLGASKFDGRVLEGKDLILEGWRVLSDAHLSRFSAEIENELMMDSSFVLKVIENEIDFRHIALQLTNGDVGSARAELLEGLFGFLFNSEMQRSNLDETEHSRSDQKSYLSSEMSVISNAATSQTDQSTLDQNDGELNADESGNLTASGAEKSEPKNELLERTDSDEVGQKSMNNLNIDSDDSAMSAVMENVDDNAEQVITDSNVAIDDRTKLAHTVHHDDALLDTTPHATNTIQEVKKYSQGSKVTTSEGNDGTNDDLLCVLRCCGGMGIAIVGAEGTKTSDDTTSEGASVADSIIAHVDPIVDRSTTVTEKDSTKSPASHVGKNHTRQPSSIECLADALTGSGDSKVDEQSTILPQPVDGNEGDEQAVISDEYLKYRRMLKMVSNFPSSSMTTQFIATNLFCFRYFLFHQGLPTGAVENAMQRDGLDPRKYISMSKVGLPDGAIRNAMVRDGLDPSLMDVLKSVMSISDEAEKGRVATSKEDAAEESEPVNEYSVEESNPQYEAIVRSTNVPAGGGSSSSIAATKQKEVEGNENDPSSPINAQRGMREKPVNIAAIAAALATKKTQKAEDELTSGSGGPMIVAAMTAAAAQKKMQKDESASNSESRKPMSIAAMAAAAAQKKTQAAEDGSTSGGPMSIAEMAAAAAQKKTQKAESGPVVGFGEPMSIAAMAAAAAQKKKEKSDAVSNPESDGPMSIAAMAAAAAQKKAEARPPAGGPMGIAAMAAAAAQKKTQKAETGPAPAGGPMSIAAMAAAAAQKKTQAAEDGSTSGGPMSIAEMAAAAAQKKTQKAESGPVVGFGEPMSIAAMAAAAAQKKKEKSDAVSNPESDGPMSIAAMAAAAAQKKAEARPPAGGPMGIAAMAAAAAQKKTQKAETGPAPAGGSMSIAAMAAAAAQKKSQAAEGGSPAGGPMSIASMAAAAAQKKTQKAETGSPAGGPMSIAAMAAAAAQKKTQAAETGPAPAGGPMSIAAMAAAAAQKKTQAAEGGSTSGGPTSIAAMAAAAAQNKTPATKSASLPVVENQFQPVADNGDSIPTGGPMSIAAMAAAAAQKKTQAAEGGSTSGGPTSIAAMAAAAAQNKTPATKSASLPVVENQFQPVADNGDSIPTSDAELTIRNDPTYEKFFKMLKMGLPMDVVKHAMKRDGMDPSIMDLDHDKSLESQRSPKVDEMEDDPPLKADEKYQKYFKMLKMVSSCMSDLWVGFIFALILLMFNFCN